MYIHVLHIYTCTTCIHMYMYVQCYNCCLKKRKHTVLYIVQLPNVCTLYSTWCIMICLVIPILSLLLFIQSPYSLSKSQDILCEIFNSTCPPIGQNCQAVPPPQMKSVVEALMTCKTVTPVQLTTRLAHFSFDM